MRFKIPLFLVIIFLLFFLGANFVLAFGLGPPRIWNEHLVPGSHFEQTITLGQPPPPQPLEIEVKMRAPEIENWITIEPGKKFTMPAVLQYPMKVIIDIPKDAGYDIYKGKIDVTAISAEKREGQITVLTGAEIDLILGVSGEEFSDFKLRDAKIPDLEVGWPIKVAIKLQNLGNVKVRPSKVYLKIYDQWQQNLLESGEATDMNWIEPFKEGEVIAKMPTKLGIGEYWAEIEIYKGEEQILKDKRYFHILEKGAIKPYPTFLGICVYIWAGILTLILIIITGIKLGFWKKLLAKTGISITIKRTK